MLRDIKKSQRVQLSLPDVQPHLPTSSFLPSGPSTRKCLGPSQTNKTYTTIRHTLLDIATHSYTDTLRYKYLQTPDTTKDTDT